ncbi:MAG: AAA family ATPase [Lachnospiraceae bacterium]|nr:AAA family ATPase [Lachnospiraceae bacterium]
MERPIWKEFRRILRSIHTKYGLAGVDMPVEPAEVVFAACTFFAQEKKELSRFLKTEQEWERYELLRSSVEVRLKKDSGLPEYDFGEMRDAFACDFAYINRITAALRSEKSNENLFSMETYEEIGSDESVTEYNGILLMVTLAGTYFYREKDVTSIMKHYLEYSKIPKRERSDGKTIDLAMLMRKALKKQLKEKVKGQDMAIDKFVDGYVRYRIRGKVPGKPAALYLFAGPPGTGKTYLAESFAQLVSNEGYAYKRFDMATYGGGGEDGGITGLVGFEKSWRNAQPGQLTQFVKKNPKCILLFDEIEKANPQIRMLFLSVLEGAVLTDRYYDEPISFEDAILIFTTNEGRDLYEENRDTNLTALADSAVIEGLRESHFAPELLSRFMSGTVVMFNYLSYLNMTDIFKASVDAAIAQISNGISFKFEYDDALSKLYLLNKGANIDARFVSANAKKMVEDYFLRAMEYVDTQKYESMQELKEIAVVVEVNDEVCEYFKRSHKPRILGYAKSSEEIYVGKPAKKHCNPPEMKVKKIEELAECDWVEREEFKKRLHTCNWNSQNRKDKYDAILIDFYGDRERKKVRYTATEGYECLKTAVEEKRNIPIILVDKEVVDWNYDIDQELWLDWDHRDMSLEDEEKSVLRTLGGTDFVQGISHKLVDWYSADADVKYHEGWEKWDLVLDKNTLEGILDRRHFVEMATQLAQKNQKISADITYDYKRESGKLQICFMNLRVEAATEENAEFRHQNRKYLLADKPQVHVKDIFGNELAKEAVKRCIDNIRHPEKYQAAGAKLMKGILMYGAPGMGKTMFAKAMAYESGAAFISAVGADFLKEDGMAKMEEMFQTARRKKPCVLFIDEFDAISESREGGMSACVKGLLEKFLKEMDGLETDNEGVYVVGATNYSPDELDSAVMRRFSSKIQFAYPNMKERQEFLLHIMHNKGLENVLSERAAKTLNLMMYESMRSYAEMENFIEETIAEAVYKETPITAKFLFDRVHNETEGAVEQEENEDRVVQIAFHEAGHAVLQWLFGRRNDYVTIVSRGNYDGYSLAKVKLYTAQDFLNQICICFAGRASEILYLKHSTETDVVEGVNIGAGSDLQKATQLAYDYVCRYGFGDSLLVVPRRLARQRGSYPEDVLPEQEKADIWNSIRQILKQQWERTEQLLQEHWVEVGALAVSLVNMKELDGEMVEEILKNKIPYIEENCLVDEW